MQLLRRVKRIERTVRPAGGCAVCRGEGPLPPVLMYRDGEPRPPLPVCAGCGRGVRGVIRVIRLPARGPRP